MKLFRFRGGVHPDARKQDTTNKPIQTLPLPRHLYVPLQQHIGAPATPEVEVGQHVLKGQRLAQNQGAISAPIHAPTSGIVAAIDDYTAPHPSALAVRTIVIEADGEERWQELIVPIDPFKLDPEDIASRVSTAGIVGLGGATFPSAVKLQLGLKQSVTTLIINGGECEPYLTCDDRLMQERAPCIVDGVRIMLHTLGAPRALVAIEDNKPAALKMMSAAASEVDNVSIVKVPSLYPMGSEKQLVRTLTGIEIPPGKRAADCGLIMHNVGTAYAVHRGIRHGRPLISRVVTVGGGAIHTPQNVEVPIGTLLSDVLDFCGGLREDPARLVMGGPMMGMMMPHDRVPVVKGSSGVIALTNEEIKAKPEMPCIRCGRCVNVCPIGLMPLEMAARLRKGDVDAALEYDLLDCISCGSCSFVCPSNIPLVHYFNFGKGLYMEKNAAEQKAAATKQLAEARQARFERQKQEKAAAAAKRKAEKAKKQAQAVKEQQKPSKQLEKKQTDVVNAATVEENPKPPVPSRKTTDEEAI